MKFYYAAGRQIRQVDTMDKIWSSGMIGYSVTRDGCRAVWRQTDRFESNLMLVENFR